MKNIYISILSCLVLLSSFGAARGIAVNPGRGIVWFKATTQALYDSLVSGDKSIWDRTLAQDCIITNEDGKVYDKSEFLKTLQPLPTGFAGHIDVQNLTVRNSGNDAVVHYWLDERENVLGQELRTKYVETDTYHRYSDTWEMVAAQTTVVPRDMAPVPVDTQGWGGLVGTYSLGTGDPHPYRVHMRAGNLYGGSDEKTARRLIPLSPLVFYAQGSIHILVFVRNVDGKVNEVLELHKYNEVAMHRVQ